MPQDQAQVYIVHGYTASPQDHWFPWLKAKMEAEGVAVSVLAMPDSAAPRFDAWQAHLDKHIDRHDPHCFYIGHSLGCISLLQHLQRQDDACRVGGLILVAGFDEPVADLEMLNAFLAPAYSPDKIKRIAPQRASIASRDDGIVPHAFSERLARKLDTTLDSIDRGGHFLGREGFTELPPLYDRLKAMLG
ncbi:hypothetical protein CEK28_17515 [Xenophilus sp. AP218F]|nr:hypothetical protein CEK28_17515 [Xenophilus sp. AP218F]